MGLDELEAPAQWACVRDQHWVWASLGRVPSGRHNADLTMQRVHWQPLELNGAGSGSFRTLHRPGIGLVNSGSSMVPAAQQRQYWQLPWGLRNVGCLLSHYTVPGSSALKDYFIVTFCNVPISFSWQLSTPASPPSAFFSLNRSEVLGYTAEEGWMPGCDYCHYSIQSRIFWTIWDTKEPQSHLDEGAGDRA